MDQPNCSHALWSRVCLLTVSREEATFQALITVVIGKVGSGTPLSGFPDTIRGGQSLTDLYFVSSTIALAIVLAEFDLEDSRW